MTRDEQRAYSRGYNSGVRGAWSKLAGSIPDQLQARIVAAAQRLSGAADHFLAMFDDRDEDKIALAVDAARDELHAAIEAGIKAALDAPKEWNGGLPPELPEGHPLSWRSWWSGQQTRPTGETYVVWRQRMEATA